MLRRPIADLDLAVEGDAVSFGQALGRRLGARARAHERFGTAALEFEDGSRLDVAASRAESYEAHGALPRVAPAPIAADLARRDFTINAMALEIGPGRRVRLHDPLGGARDLSRGVIRMLHAGSAMDDPTRAFRAARYANRLGFRVERRTRQWIGEALRSGAFEAVSGDRLRREMRLLLSEEDPAGAVRHLCGLGLQEAVHRALPCGDSVLARLARAERLARKGGTAADWLTCLLLWAGDLSARQTREIAVRLSLPREEARILTSWPSTWKALAAGHVPSGSRGSALSQRESAAARAMLPREAGGAKVARATAAAHLRLHVRGGDLIAAGMTAGPRIGRALDATLAARREGRITSEQELAFALKAARKEAF